MEIRFTNRGSTLIASFSGELDHHFAEYARNKIEGELLKATTRNVIFDLSGLSFMDSSGIGVLVGRYANIKKLGEERPSSAEIKRSGVFSRSRG